MGHYFLDTQYLEGYRDESIRSLVKPLHICVKQSQVPEAMVSHECMKIQRQISLRLFRKFLPVNSQNVNKLLKLFDQSLNMKIQAKKGVSH